MNKILVEVSVGELLDKLTILEIKKDKIKDLQNTRVWTHRGRSVCSVLEQKRRRRENGRERERDSTGHADRGQSRLLCRRLPRSAGGVARAERGGGRGRRGRLPEQ